MKLLFVIVLLVACVRVTLGADCPPGYISIQLGSDSGGGTACVYKACYSGGGNCGGGTCGPGPTLDTYTCTCYNGFTLVDGTCIPVCPAGIVTANTTIGTNDVILVKSPLLTHDNAFYNVCNCFGKGWALGNTSNFFAPQPSKSNQTAQASTALRAFLAANLPLPTSVWFGYPPPYLGNNGVVSDSTQCPVYQIPDASTTIQTSEPCGLQKPAICARSKLVYNPVGSPCDNNLQVCAQGAYCNAAPGGTGTCAVDNICFPTNPCATGLTNAYNKLDAACTVTPGAPGGYTCECGLNQAPTNAPGVPQTCVECPSANPCALIQCPAGSGCAYGCGDYRGLRCETPGGVIVPPVTAPPPTPTNGATNGPQGVCGTGAAASFPTRCWFNNDPQGRYVCCDNQGCSGFNSDNLTPHCKNNGYAPPNFGTSPAPSPPPASPPTGSQGVCGSGAAASFPTRCWFNNDPQGRYVCCDNDGCNGFAPPDNTFPTCKTNGYAPPGFGV